MTDLHPSPPRVPAFDRRPTYHPAIIQQNRLNRKETEEFEKFLELEDAMYSNGYTQGKTCSKPYSLLAPKCQEEVVLY